MVIGGHAITFCGPRYYCSDCRAKRRNFGKHCPADVISITKVCRQLHDERALLPLKTNTFCRHAQDLDATIRRYCHTKVEKDAIRSIWAVDCFKYTCERFRYLGGLEEVIVSACKEENIQMLPSMEEEELKCMIRNMGRELRMPNAKVWRLREGEQAMMPAMAWTLLPDLPSSYIFRHCDMKGHWMEDCTAEKLGLEQI
jgi:hypothetical protein